jgi:hypothetical protein
MIFDGSTCDEIDDDVVKNNIITNITSALYSFGADCYSTANFGVDDIEFDYNSFEHSGVFWTSESSGTIESTLSSFITNYSQGSNQWDSVDCLYANEGNNDFRLCTASGVPDASCTGASTCIENGANDGLDVLDLDNDSSTSDPITLGVYITGDEEIGIEEDSPITTHSNFNGVSIQ